MVHVGGRAARPDGGRFVTDDDPQPSVTAQFLRALVPIVLAAGGLAFLALAMIGALLANSFRECNGSPWIHASTSTLSTVTLDAAHPVSQQTVTVRIPALALPDDVVEDGIQLTVDPDAIP